MFGDLLLCSKDFSRAADGTTWVQHVPHWAWRGFHGHRIPAMNRKVTLRAYDNLHVVWNILFPCGI